MFKPVTKMLILFCLAVCLALPATSFAADNIVTGDVAGDTNGLSTSNTFTINAQQLALTKKAFLTDGTPVAHDSTLPRGTKVHFLIYVNNRTALAVANVNVVDPLTGFAFTSGDLLRIYNGTGECSADICLPAEEQDIYDELILSGITLAEDTEDTFLVAGYDAAAVPPEITAGSGRNNAQLDIAANKVWAMVFEATLQ